MSVRRWLRRTVDQGVARMARAPDMPWWGAALAGIGCALVMLAVRKGLEGLYGDVTGFMILLPAVMIAGLTGGVVAGLVAVAVCLAGGWVIFGLSLPRAGWRNQLGQVATANFILVGVFASVLSASLRSTVRRLDASLQALEVSSGEARASEAARRDTEVQLRGMIEQAAVGIARLNLHGEVVSANARLAELLGRSPGEIIGIRTRDVTHPDDVEPTLDRLSSAGGQLEKRYMRPDGSVVWGLTSLAPLTMGNGAIEGHIAVVVDITDAKSIESALRESETRFRAIADTAPVLIWVTGPDRKRIFVNQAYVAYYGSTYETALDAPWQEALHPDDFGRIVRESLAGEATGEPFSLEARYRRHDGEYRWLKSFSRPRRGGRGELAGFVGVAFDITDARRAGEDLKRINDLLEERVGAALAEKARAEADLMHAQRMEAVGRLTGGVAHDFNNLLTVVIGALDMMLRAPEDTARLKKLGTAALAAARRGEGLTHQLLAFSRRQALRPEAVDLNDLIRNGAPLLKRAVGDSIAFETRFRRGGARVRVDVAQFEAALLNLLVNARDALGDRKHGRVSVRTHSCMMEAGAVPDLATGRYVCVSVQDNGAGMDAATVARVFEPFFTTKPVGKGTGLGLSQVYGFARQSGGGVEIHSVPGKGTDIRLYLPPLDPERPDRPPAGPVETLNDRATAAARIADLEGRSLLLVEDDAQVCEMAVALLDGFGLRTQTAATGAQALAALTERRFDLMLSDVVMPGGMTGIELARICAARWPEMKILLTSGYAGEDVDEALADAPWRLLPKPYSGDQLREALARELSVTG